MSSAPTPFDPDEYQAAVDRSVVSVWGQEIVDVTREEGFRLLPCGVEGDLRAALDLPGGVEVVPIFAHGRVMPDVWRDSLRHAREQYA